MTIAPRRCQTRNQFTDGTASRKRKGAFNLMLDWVDPRIFAEVNARWPDTSFDWDAAVTDLLTAGFVPRNKLSGDRFGLVAAGTWEGLPAVAKVDPDPQKTHSWAVARDLAGIGIGPRILAADPHTGWVVMKQVQPGLTALQRLVDPTVLGTTLGRLQGLPEKPDLPPLDAFLRDRLTRPPTTDIARSSTPVPAQERDMALRLLGQLPCPARAIHGDCSRGNILHSRTGIVLVDPRGISGDWQFDVAVAAWKNRYSTTATRTLIRASGADFERVTAWERIARAARL